MSAGALDRLAARLQSMALHVHENYGSGVERFRCSKATNPLRITELGGELVLEDGDPDFTIGETLRSAIAGGTIHNGDLVLVARHAQEWHAFDWVHQ